jgi:hypothetical protein
MTRFLKIISGLNLVLVWFAFVLVISVADARTPAEMLAAVFAAVSLSIPSAVLFAFAQILEDVRSMRNNLRLQSHHLVIWNASSSHKRALGPLKESACGECRYERPADRAVGAESGGADVLGEASSSSPRCPVAI